MIQAHELRIGNWVDTVYNVPYIKITEIKESVICGKNCKVMSYGSLKPIPLTEEILLKCGFEKCEKHDNFYQIILNDWTKMYVAFHEKQYVVELSVSKHSFCPNVKYLHQLQNLYQALTGQELKIEL